MEGGSNMKTWVSNLIMGLKLIVFVSFLVTSWVMYDLGRKDIAIVILMAVLFFVAYSKLDNLDKRVKRLEE